MGVQGHGRMCALELYHCQHCWYGIAGGWLVQACLWRRGSLVQTTGTRPGWLVALQQEPSAMTEQQRAALVCRGCIRGGGVLCAVGVCAA